MTMNPSFTDTQPTFLNKFVEAYISGPSRAFLRSFEASLLSQIQLESPVLDLACGDGLVSALTFDRVLDNGCDLMMNQLRKAKIRGQYKTLALADVRELPYKDSSFSTIISNSSIEHIPVVEKVIKEAFRVLKPGGIFVFTVPNPRFNDWFWKNWIWSRLGKPDLGLRSIDDFNKLREHHNIYNADQWNELLIASGFIPAISKEYFPFRATFVFSIIESFWNYNLVVPRLPKNGSSHKRINLAGGFLRLLPKRLSVFLQDQTLALFSRQNSTEQGSHLFVAAKK